MEFRPFRVSLVTAFRGVRERTGVLIRGVSHDGQETWGEYSPFPDYDARRASLWWASAMEAVKGEWPVATRASVHVNSIVPVVPVDQVARYATAGGCVVAKVKVGGPGTTLADDCARVEAAADAVRTTGGAAARVRVDANGQWGADQAVRALQALDAAARTGGLAGLEYAEQPCATIEEMVAVRKAVDIPIAADESVRLPEDPLAIVRAGAADILVLKVAPLGGVLACLDIAQRAELPIVVSSALETSVGLSAGLALALALPDLPYACGLGTGALIEQDVVAHPLIPVGGRMVSRPLVVTV
jgi:O-succinylbenzoate synthase